jgi:hypothetical protein
MRYLLAFFLLTSVVLAQKPKAPFSDPNDPDDPAMKLEYKGELTVPKNGLVQISFTPEPFGREPGCSFEGGTLPGKAPKVTRYYAEIQAKPKAKMKYRCSGIRPEALGKSEEH